MKIAFYGTLMRGFDAQKRLGVEGSLRFERSCRIPGALWDLGTYPALVEGEAETAGEIYEILDQMRATIPEEIKQARWIVKERQEMLAEAKREGDRILGEAKSADDLGPSPAGITRDIASVPDFTYNLSAPRRHETNYRRCGGRRAC